MERSAAHFHALFGLETGQVSGASQPSSIMHGYRNTPAPDHSHNDINIQRAREELSTSSDLSGIHLEDKSVNASLLDNKMVTLTYYNLFIYSFNNDSPDLSIGETCGNKLLNQVLPAPFSSIQLPSESYEGEERALVHSGEDSDLVKILTRQITEMDSAHNATKQRLRETEYINSQLLEKVNALEQEKKDAEQRALTVKRRAVTQAANDGEEKAKLFRLMADTIQQHVAERREDALEMDNMLKKQFK